MLRLVLPILCAGCSMWTAGVATQTCGDAECAPACAEAEAKVVVPEGGVLLTRYEAERLMVAREGLKLGLHPTSPWPILRWCKGASTCEQMIDPAKLIDLPGGTYVLHLNLQAPPSGVWEAIVDIGCSEGGPPARRERVRIGSKEGDPTGPDPLLVTPEGWAGKCTVKAIAPDGSELVAIVGTFSATPAPLSFVSMDTLKNQPLPTIGTPGQPDQVAAPAATAPGAPGEPGTAPGAPGPARIEPAP